MSLKSLSAEESSALVVDALRHDGGVIVRNLAPTSLIDAVARELRPRLDISGEEHRDGYATGFGGRKTLRCYACCVMHAAAAS